MYAFIQSAPNVIPSHLRSQGLVPDPRLHFVSSAAFQSDRECFQDVQLH